MSSSTGSRQQGLHAVGLLPGKEINLLAIILPALGLATEMSVTRGRPVNWTLELQRVNDAFGSQVKYIVYNLLECSVGQHTGAEGLDQDRDRPSHADSV